eukprot:scaffold233073_cov23-Tisochrysis_lutea.AAC.1
MEKRPAPHASNRSPFLYAHSRTWLAQSFFFRKVQHLRHAPGGNHCCRARTAHRRGRGPRHSTGFCGPGTAWTTDT